jgi:hypothetical protein
MESSTTHKREQREPASRKNGLIIVCGPPFSGKCLIGTRLAECIPNSVKLSAEDNLSRAGEVWYPDVRKREPIFNPQNKMLETAVTMWESGSAVRTPVVILVARFAKPSARYRAYEMALASNAAFLLVQALSTNMKVMRRVSNLLLPSQLADRRIKQISKAVKTYRPVTAHESRQFDCLRLKGDLSALDDLFSKVVNKWLV